MNTRSIRDGIRARLDALRKRPLTNDEFNRLMSQPCVGPTPKAKRAPRRTNYLVRLHSPVHTDEPTRWIAVLAHDEQCVREAVRHTARSKRLQPATGYTPFDQVDVWPLAVWCKAKGYPDIWAYMASPDAEFHDISRLHVSHD